MNTNIITTQATPVLLCGADFVLQARETLSFTATPLGHCLLCMTEKVDTTQVQDILLSVFVS